MDELSFPSGHTIAVFVPAFYLYRKYKLKYSMPIFLTAFIGGLSRIIAKKHYISDVLFGMCLSYIIVRIFVKSKKQ